MKLYSEASAREILKEGSVSEDTCIYKQAEILEETRAVNESALTIDFVISSSSIDRMHDTIDQAGWDLKAFKKNPIVLWAHDQSQPPVAKAIPRSLKVDGKKLKATAQFMPAEISEFSYMIFQMYKLGFMNATSVGFRPLEWTFAEDDKRPYGVNFTKQELLEFSCVPVPANADALMGAKSMGVNTRPLKSWVENILDNWKEDNGLMVPRSDLEALQKSISARVKLMKPIEDIMAKTETNEEIEVKTETVVKPELTELVEKTIEGAAAIEKKAAEGNDVAVSQEHNPEIHASMREAHAMHGAALNLTRAAASIHKSAMAKMKCIFAPDDPADGSGDDYANGKDFSLTANLEVELKALSEQVTKMAEKLEKSVTPVVKEEKVEVTKEVVTEETKEVPVVETKESNDFIISFEDSVDKEEDSVSFDEVKALLNSLDLSDLIEKSLKTKLEV